MKLKMSNLLVTRDHAVSSNLEITEVSSGILNGFVMKSSIPASRASFVCSARAFAETAMIGMCLRMSPEPCNSRILFEQVRPSMIGISMSMRITCTSDDGVVPNRSCCFQIVVVDR
jgi:hypothetical protein